MTKLKAFVEKDKHNNIVERIQAPAFDKVGNIYICAAFSLNSSQTLERSKQDIQDCMDRIVICNAFTSSMYALKNMEHWANRKNEYLIQTLNVPLFASIWKVP